MAAQFSYFTTSADLREIVKQVDANTQFQYIAAVYNYVRYLFVSNNN